MNSRQKRTLENIFADPLNGNIKWSNIESLFMSIGCSKYETSGSGLVFEKNGVRAYFHRPHPAKEAMRYRVKDAREFLGKIGVRP